VISSSSAALRGVLSPDRNAAAERVHIRHPVRPQQFLGKPVLVFVVEDVRRQDAGQYAGAGVPPPPIRAQQQRRVDWSWLSGVM
jgi:hypothetical protein